MPPGKLPFSLKIIRIIVVHSTMAVKTAIKADNLME
jgi:hypothetical protein